MSLQTISEFARRFGLSRATLLYYHRIGLLKPSGYSPAGYRLYGEPALVRMERIETLRQAGLPLRTIQQILDQGEGDTLEQALERRLVALNDEITQLRSQQRLVATLLRREGAGQLNVDVAQWVALLEEAGVDEAGRLRWHQAFERDAPAAHQQFLLSLGLEAEAVALIRSRARGESG